MRRKLGEYLVRFPDLAEDLRVQFEVHQAIETEVVAKMPEIPGFAILAEIGRGGMGIVYKACDPQRDQIVAVKVVRPELVGRKESRQRFLREARTAAALGHPNIVRMFDVGDSSVGPFLVMEWIDGESLETALAKGSWPIADAVRLLIVVADAVHYAHSRGIIHRDLKPANILLISNGGTASVLPKIVDFGLAKSLRPSGSGYWSTQEGTLIGSLAYMPPEQMGEKIARPGPWNDVYSLGGILFAMLTGRPPYEEKAIVAAILRVRSAAEPPRMLPLRPETPDELERICRKCLSTSPSDRYQSARDLADDLRRFAGISSPNSASDDVAEPCCLIPLAGSARFPLARPRS